MVVFSYVAYNLGIQSAIPIPELVAAEGAAVDVTVRLGSVDRPAAHIAKEGLVFANAREACLSFKQVATFWIRDGREILVDPVSGVDERWVRIGLLGPVMGALLYQRGFLTLHASCVAVGGEAVAFLGERGWGKSTLAATMCSWGHRLVADDITPVRVNGTAPPEVCSGYPQLKLWPDAAVSLGEDLDELPRLDPLSERRARRTDHELPAEPMPLRRVYVLGWGENPEIEPVGSQDGLLELIRHTYGRELFQAVHAREHFLKCAGVVNGAVLRSLRRPHSLSALPDLAGLVEEDLRVGQAIPG